MFLFRKKSLKFRLHVEGLLEMKTFYDTDINNGRHSIIYCFFKRKKVSSTHLHIRKLFGLFSDQYTLKIKNNKKTTD